MMDDLQQTAGEGFLYAILDEVCLHLSGDNLLCSHVSFEWCQLYAQI